MRLFKPRIPKVKIGSQKVPVRPLTLENTLRLALLLGPHLAVIEERWPVLQRALKDRSGERPQLLRALFAALREELAEMPGDMLAAFGLLIDREISWMVENEVSATDLIEALPVLDEINDFSALWGAFRDLGLTVRYARKNADSGENGP